MFDENAARALSVGAGVFISMVIITAIIAYYSNARDMMRENYVYNNMNELYLSSIEKTLAKEVVSGYEIKNILHYYYKNKDVNITLNVYNLLNTRDDLGDLKLLGEAQNINNNMIAYNEIMNNLCASEHYSMIKYINDEFQTVYEYALIG